jgi:lipoate-protein ligase A
MLTVYDQTFTPALDTAVSHALLREVADGGHEPALRLYQPADVVAFGKRDVVADGFESAVASARACGFEPTIRLAGGRAAVFHANTIAFAWTVPNQALREGITERFEHLSHLMAGAFRSLGADARVGQVPGEYCPGEYSVNVAGTRKVMGVGQRIIAGAAHVGGVIVVDDAPRINGVLEPVYDDLGLSWDPAATGDLAAAAPGITWGDVRDVVLQTFAGLGDVVQASIPERIMQRASELAPKHAVSREP